MRESQQDYRVCLLNLLDMTSLILNRDISWIYLYSFALFMKCFLR